MQNYQEHQNMEHWSKGTPRDIPEHPKTQELALKNPEHVLKSAHFPKTPAHLPGNQEKCKI